NNYADVVTSIANSNGNPAVFSHPTFPKLWYASLTVGIRFPFGEHSEATSEEPTSTNNNSVSDDGKVTLTGRVTDDKTGDPVSANMTVVDLTNNEVVATDHTNSDGRYNVRVKSPGKYSVTADADGYLFGTSYFEVDAQGRILSRHPDIKLSSTAGGRVRLLVFFDFNKSTLSSESYPELNRAVRLMKAVPAMTVEIAGYTDNVGSDDVNQKLSQQRANAVRNYIVQNGVTANRVTAKGYGKASPIADNSTDDGRAENRRVEFVVTSR
ncbi:MAG TPA: OmpA family protein, partial [Candidatus Kapabacteria bacterium]